MSKTESIIEAKITKAFSGIKPKSYNFNFSAWPEFTDSWLEENEDLFLYHSHEDELFLLPAFLCYLLRNFRTTLDSVIYERMLGNIERIQQK